MHIEFILIFSKIFHFKLSTFCEYNFQFNAYIFFKRKIKYLKRTKAQRSISAKR